MLSSTQKSVPTTKQFRQPYFLHIAPDGALLTACSRFSTFLKKRNIQDFQGQHLLEVFSRLGTLRPELSGPLTGNALPTVLDLSVQGPGNKSFVIRWLLTPQYGMERNAVGWQLTGLKVYPGSVAEPIDRRRTAPEEVQVAANLIKEVSDIIVAAD